MSERTLCLPCTLALRPPVTATPHGCPGQLQVFSGTGQLRVRYCACPVCWPDRAAEGAAGTAGDPPEVAPGTGDGPAEGSGGGSGQSLDDLGPWEQRQGGPG
ncbi:hypothetical protein [Micromonospora sp. HM5-17]|jgi:hypothetical protein|uniref:hypothetical protein n=1 Tax=Micromonospora sp. HM5-17 TaxID=2487710 RepID=UPI0013156257|nr:hypothetical protein [Micromonospora sp. HM5-17]